MNTSLPPVRITTTGSETARVSVRRHLFEVGRPLTFDAEYGQITAFEYALGALGAEVVGGLRAFAQRRRVVLDHVEAVVKAELDNALTYLEVVGESGSPALSKVSIRVYVSSPENAQTVTRLWEDTIARLPLVCSLRHVLHLILELSLTS